MENLLGATHTVPRQGDTSVLGCGNPSRSTIPLSSAELRASDPLQSVTSPLFLDGWLEFNRIRWGVTPSRRVFAATDGGLPSIESVFYLARGGRVTQPPRNPYLPVLFKSTQTDSPTRVQRQWLEVAEEFALALAKSGLARAIALPPEIIDVRPWQWNRFRAGERYTFYIDFPYRLERADAAIRKQVRKATAAGYAVTTDSDMKAVHECLRATELRQGFSHHLSLTDLELLGRLIGEAHCRVYVCRSPEGQPVSARIVLHAPGARAIDWVAGTSSAHLNAGVTQLTIASMLDDLQAAGASGFDFAGADLRSVAAAKAGWGGELKSYRTLESTDVRLLLKTVRDVVKVMSRRKGERP